MSEAPGALGRPRSRRRGKLQSDRDKIASLVCAVIIEWMLNRERQRPKKLSGTEDTISKNKPVALRTAGLPSIAEILGNGVNTGKDKKSPKFPKDTVKLLENALKKVVMRQDPAYDDAHLRATFGVFYGYYTTDAFQKSVKDNRKVEDLILMFFSKATGELQKRASEEDVQSLVNQHVASFIRLLLETLRSNRLVSQDSELLCRLELYEKKLLQNARLLEPKFEDSLASVSVQDESDPNVSSLPTIHMLQELLHLDISQMQTLISDVKTDCSLNLIRQNLKARLEVINNAELCSYKEHDFEEPLEYLAWKQNEVQILSNTVLHVGKLTSSLSLATKHLERLNLGKFGELGQEQYHSHSSDPYVIPETMNNNLAQPGITTERKNVLSESILLTKFPSDVFAAYEYVLRKVMQYNLSQNHNRPGVVDNELPALFGGIGRDILAQCRSRWRITNGVHKSICMSLCQQSFDNHDIDLELLDETLYDIKSNENTDQDFFTKADKALYKSALYGIADSLFRDLYTELEAVFSRRLDVRIVVLLEEHVISDSMIHEDDSRFSQMINELEAGFKSASQGRYRSNLQQARAVPIFEVLNIVNLGQDLLRQMQAFRKMYKNAILGNLDLSHIFIRAALPHFLGDLKMLLEECYRNAKQQDCELAIRDMFELYHCVQQMHTCLAEVDPGYRSPVSVDLYFRPFVLRWLHQAHTTVTSLVSKIIDADDFISDHAVDTVEEISSQSVLLLFKSFNQHLQYLRELRWQDEYWAAKFVTSLCHTYSEAIKEYSVTLEKLFYLEVSPPASLELETDEIGFSLQQRLLSRARDVLTKRVSTELFHIPPAACIKLNNIESAKLHLDQLEKSIDAVRLSNTIISYEGEKSDRTTGTSTVFTVKVLSAEDLIPCDSNGFSDPYVVLSDAKGKRVGKTRTIYTDLNPRWNESFDVSTTEPLWLAATVWDRDKGGEHDICGRCYFKLDPKYFRDFEPREFHINLDTQGTLHLRITMEGDVDDATFYFSRAFRYLERAEADMVRSIIDKMTPFMSAIISRSTLKTLVSRPLTFDKTIDTAYTLLSRAGIANLRPSVKDRQPLSNQDIETSVEPLLQYLDNNFKILDSCLSRSAFLKVMTQLWDFVLVTIEELIIPGLSSRREKSRRCLDETELDIVYKWLAFLKDTFAGDGGGLSDEELQTTRYNEVLSIRFFYFDSDAELIRECERMVDTHAIEVQMGPKTTMRPCNLGTIKLLREQRLARQRRLGNSEETILRVLKLRDGDRAKEFVQSRIDHRNQLMKIAVDQAGMTRRESQCHKQCRSSLL